MKILPIRVAGQHETPQHRRVSIETYEVLEAREATSLISDTLERVNEIRQAAGFKPLKSLRGGVPGDTSRCPIAMSLKEFDATGLAKVDVDGDGVLEFSDRSFARKVWDRLKPKGRYELNNEGVDNWGAMEGDSLKETDAVFYDFINRFDSQQLPKLKIGLDEARAEEESILAQYSAQ